MTTSEKNRKVRIIITTFKKEELNTTDYKQNMNQEKYIRRNDTSNRFICSICLNSSGFGNVDSGRRNKRSCPVCKSHPSCQYLPDNTKVRDLANTKIATKTVQTSQTNLNHDLNLLKEVLTVFQNKKVDIKKKSVQMKDISVATAAEKNIKPKLATTKVFHLSIDSDNAGSKHFQVVNRHPPDTKKPSTFSINLSKRKSSSIPLMKMEELRHSMKEKTTSKDAVEEVNRMFATVKRSGESHNHINRPFTRNGPRVLPVVKAKYQDWKENSDVEDYSHDTGCKCCQTENIQMSAGDSFHKHECCYHKMLCEGKCEKCVHMLCCAYKKRNNIDDELVCDCCHKGNWDQKTDDSDHS